MAARGSIRSRSRARDGVVTLESGVVVTLKKTALHAEPDRPGAKLVDFAGWDMPIQSASHLDQHPAVRQADGMVTVANLIAVDLSGARTRPSLQKKIRRTSC